MAAPLKNVFWVGANILFDLKSPLTQEVLLLVYREEDATIFSDANAENIKSAVSVRAPNIVWSLQRLKSRPGFSVVKGEQDVRF
jgi:hypothetical protein